MYVFFQFRGNGEQYSGCVNSHRLTVRWFPDRTELFQWKVLSLNLARLIASAVGGLGLINLGLSSHFIIGLLEVFSGVENW